MTGFAFPVLLVLAAVALVVVIAVKRSGQNGEERGDGSDIIAYLVLAVAMGVTGFALAQLARTAFPGTRFVFDPAADLANALAALVVAAPFLIYFWRRQATRRGIYPATSGWTLYLSLMEAVFMTAFVVNAVQAVSGLMTGDDSSAWPTAVIFGLIVVFHELAVRRTPPRSDAAELARVIGSAIGLITGTIGLSGTVAQAFTLIFGLGEVGWHPWVAMALVGVPVWAYRWLRPWEASEPSGPRLTWTTLVTVGTTIVAIGSATALVVWSLQYVFGDAGPARTHFDMVPVALGLLIPSAIVALIHRRALGTERTNPVRVVDYSLAAVGLAAGVGGAVSLTVAAFDRSVIVGGGADDVIAFATVMVLGILLWRVVSRRADRAEEEFERTSWPRRLYHLGLGVVFGLIAAGALITALVIILREVMASGAPVSGLVAPLALFIFTGLAAWYLLAAYSKDRTVMGREEVIAPFDVTIVTSHPGLIATKFPKQARLQVIHRGDDAGGIDDATADAIVEAVGRRSSVVWVDADGFRVAPLLRR